MAKHLFVIGSFLLVGAVAVLGQQSGGTIKQSEFQKQPTTTLRHFYPSDRSRLNIAMGMPAPATTDPKDRDAFLILRPQSAVSYSDRTRTPNWVAWHINRDSLPQDYHFRRQEFFTFDPKLPKT